MIRTLLTLLRRILRFFEPLRVSLMSLHVSAAGSLSDVSILTVMDEYGASGRVLVDTARLSWSNEIMVIIDDMELAKRRESGIEDL